MYTLGPHHQNVMSGLWKDLPYKLEKKVRENWVDALCLLVPVIGTYQLRRDGSARAACGWALGRRRGWASPSAAPAQLTPVRPAGTRWRSGRLRSCTTAIEH